ncbi:hypothetical protein UFOVP1357_55 [uncultured Caudovirales phage]|uniref:Uncharacterized protein n=1 Tax=uncultured Caudovirales phage TaxID=2100421 RepID=A0A6J5LHH8_9CAUD|nr:hypothetical protein UFOVP18_17 [uncultured Caudovirales phage]CAB4126728.1 hypothetical protein UFOVP82_19 [uncultured Caudovirales phage]CAB4132370.1 hypothetical protein UFOVP258_10 [uncultured Caudovirales phage]CAB4146308.1 hypothetical protein UFOVP502_2 [uncultured Caudovirales phage]CAB4200591.1 hypothetical protein UFOVP1357_55 [uncultured Caudovirales phage]
MMTTNLQQSPYLREQRQFPSDDLKELANQSDHAYIDIASKVNVRTIGIFAVNFPVITGESWYVKGQPQKQQTLRQLYTINGAGTYPHGIKLNQITGLTRIYGTFTDGTNWYPLPFVASSNILTTQVSIFVDPTNIVIAQAGATPVISSGFVVLEWLSMF